MIKKFNMTNIYYNTLESRKKNKKKSKPNNK